jgi:hypothetical protein
MKLSNIWDFRSFAVRVMTGLALVALIGSIDVAPAMAKDNNNHDRGAHHDNARHEQRRHGHGHDRGGRYYGYAEPVYVAPPVYYAPPPAPGISIFLPTIHIR